MNKWDAWIYPADGEPVKVGRVRAESIDDALAIAHRMAPPLATGASLCLVKPGADVTREARQRTLFQARLWRASEMRRVGGHVAKKKRRKPAQAIAGGW